ncbi:MAG: PAS domain-containing protein [Asticcacaulis sp.]
MSGALLNTSGSETGRQILAHDWAATPLGPLEDWSPELRATLELMLACPTAMFLAWGPDLRCFFNDAYRPVLGYRLPEALGRPFSEVWSTIWDDIGPLVEATLKGETRVMTDMPLDLARHGEPEMSWWTFTYSPAFEGDRINGLFCVTRETTDRVVAETARKAADARLEMALSAGGGVGLWDWDVVEDRVTADARFGAMYGVDPLEAAQGAPIEIFFKGIHPDDLSRVKTEIAQVMKDGGVFRSEYRLIDADGQVRWVIAQGQCVYDNAGKCIRLPGVSYDISDRVAAEESLKLAKAERDFVIELTARQRLHVDPEAIIRFSAEAMGRRLHVDRVGFYRVLGTNRLLHGGNWTNGRLPPLIGEHPSSTFGRHAEQIRSQGRVLVFSDSRHDEGGDLLAYTEAGVLSGLCIPLMNEGMWQAGIYMHQAEVRYWTPAEISLAKEVAQMTWLAVERAEALLRLSQRVDRQEAALVEAAKEVETQALNRKRAEEQLRQLQKMEAVGQLTGGIAHDFNNMLAIIMGGLNLAKAKLARGDTDILKFLDGALDGATSAASLTQRLLAFSRQQPLSPQSLDANRLVASLSDMLGRTLGEPVRLETVLSAGLWRANADPAELENAIVNLAVNARDAMPEGGRLTIETGNSYIDETYAREVDVKPGQYVMIAVSDTGTGMPPEVIARAFDPFFTTKGVGKGTGLGLSQVFGFVRQSGGHVRLYSEVGHGSTFKIYLPRFWGEETPERLLSATPIRGGRREETVLVVEDEARVRNFTVDTLRELGYTVVAAANGPEALSLLKAGLGSGQAVSLLFTDVVMPEMTGRQLADKAQIMVPGLKVLYTTGYTRNAVVHNGVLDPGTHFLPKPFSIEQVAQKIRGVLDGE